MSWTEGGLASAEGGLGLLASAGGDGRIIIWQIVESRPRDAEAESQPAAAAAAASATEGTDDARIKIYPVAAAREAHGVSDVNALQWCPRGEGKGRGLLASCGDDGSVKVWRVVNE